MKAIINGRTYNTNTATALDGPRDNYDRIDGRYYQHTLFVTRNGRKFVHYSGRVGRPGGHYVAGEGCIWPTPVTVTTLAAWDYD